MMPSTGRRRAPWLVLIVIAFVCIVAGVAGRCYYPVAAQDKPTAPIAPTNDNVKSLRDEMLTLIAANDRRYTDALASQKEATAASFAALRDATAQALAAQKEAVTKAEEASTKRFESVNEFRGQLKDQAATLMPKAEADARFASIERQLTELKEGAQKVQSRGEGSSAVWGYIVGIGGLVVGVIAVMISLRPKSKE